MRLIDADKLLTKAQDYGEGQEKLILIDPYYVKNAKTVQAIPIPDNATNGEVLKTMFPNIEANEIKTDTGGYIEVKYLDTTDKRDATAFRKNWWNAPYKRGNSDGSN